MVMDALGASPVKRLEIETPSSASRPCPLLARGLDDRGVLGTVGDQDAAQLAVVPAEGRDPVRRCPCRIACWLAGVVHGSCTVHSCSACAAGVHPAPQRRHRPGRERPLHHREGHAVELDEHDAVDVGVAMTGRA